MSIIEEIDERAQELRDTGAIVSLIDWDTATQESLERELDGFNLEYNVIPLLLRKFQYNKGDGLVMIGINWGELEGIEPIVHEFMQICNEIGKVKGPWGPLMYCMEDPNQPGAKLSKREGNTGKFTQDFVFVEPRATMERIMTLEKYIKRKYSMKKIKGFKAFEGLEGGEQLIYDQINTMIEANQFLKGKVVADKETVFEAGDFILLLGDLTHITDAHVDETIPGSKFDKGIDLKKAIISLVSGNKPTEMTKGFGPSETKVGNPDEAEKLKWLGLDSKVPVGVDNIYKSEPNNEEFKSMNVYTYKDSRGNEFKIKVKEGEGEKTTFLSFIGAKLGKVGEKIVLSVMTAFPGQNGAEVANRNDFEKLGYYFTTTNKEVIENSVGQVAEGFKHLRKFNEKFTNFTNGDYLPQEMAFADLMSDADIEDRFDVTRDYRPTIYKKSVIYNFTIKTGEWVNDGMRSVTYTKPENLYEDFKKRTDFVEEIYIACQRTQDEYPEVKLEMTESCTISSVLGNKLTIKVIMSINEKNEK